MKHISAARLIKNANKNGCDFNLIYALYVLETAKNISIVIL